MTDVHAAPLVGGHALNYYFSDAKVSSLLNAVASGHFDRARQDLKNGADVNAVGKDGITPLLWVMTTGFDREKIDFLLRSGANPNYVDPSSRMSAMYVAAGGDRPDILELLLAHKGNPNLPGPGDKTPLMSAVSEGRDANVDILLKHGADLGAKDALQLTAPEIAISVNRYDIAYALVEKGYKGDLVRLARMAARTRTTPGSKQAEWQQKLIDQLARKGRVS